MEQKIIQFHQDQNNHWVADLECGHRQHVRHDPPWMERPWVLSAEGRSAKLGHLLHCTLCDDLAVTITAATIAECYKTLQSSYEEAGLSGLCDEGRFEVALESIKSISIEQILKKKT